MPLVKANGATEQERLAARIRNTRRLLTVAAAIMSVYLLATSLVTTVLIPSAEFQEVDKPAGGRWRSWPTNTLVTGSGRSTTSVPS